MDSRILAPRVKPDRTDHPPRVLRGLDIESDEMTNAPSLARGHSSFHPKLTSPTTRWLEPNLPYSVAFGWPVPAALIHKVRRAVSTRYQMRPPAVTSYCH